MMTERISPMHATVLHLLHAVHHDDGTVRTFDPPLPIERCDSLGGYELRPPRPRFAITLAGGVQLEVVDPDDALTIEVMSPGLAGLLAAQALPLMVEHVRSLSSADSSPTWDSRRRAAAAEKRRVLDLIQHATRRL